MAAHDAGPTGPGAVVLDIGDDVGALVVSTSPELLGEEVQLDATGPPHRRTHALVRRRDVGATAEFAAVFTSVPAGECQVWHTDGARVRTRVAGGTVTRLVLLTP